MPSDTIELLEVWFLSEEAHSRKLGKTEMCIFKRRRLYLRQKHIQFDMYEICL